MTTPDVIPVTVLTGYLGAGKTTLLNHLLTQKHGHRCALVINEFGAIGIDHQLVVGADEEIVELNNGCLCCRVRGDLIRSLQGLFQKQKRFDYVLIETTGLADPGPIAQTFKSSELAQRLRLDGIVTVVDARHFEKELNDGPEARAQVAFADVLVLNKTDLAPPRELERLEARLRKMNPVAQVYRAERAQIDVGRLLNLHARDLSTKFAMPESPRAPVHTHHGHEEEAGHSHSHEHPHEEESHGGEAHGHEHHHHDEEVGSFCVNEDQPLDRTRVEAWLTELIQTLGPTIYRAKGVLYLQGVGKRVIFQMVQMIFDAQPDRFWHPNERRQSQLVFIGKKLDEAKIRAGFAACRAKQGV